MLPLDGVRVLDFTRMMQGPYCSQLLGDMGADIIKVEMPGLLDARYGNHGEYGSVESDATFAAAEFLASNRNKRSIAIDLRHPEGREVTLRLVRQCDVVMENFRPEVMHRLELSYETLSEINPRIVYSSQSGWGQGGPYVYKPGQDILAQALSGLASITGGEGTPPTPVGVPIGDLVGATFTAYGIMVALFVREKTGVGQRVSTSLLDCLIAAQPQEVTHYLNTKVPPLRPPAGNGHPFLPPPYGVFKTLDSYIALSGPGSRLDVLCQVLGIENLAEDPRFGSYNRRAENRKALQIILNEAVSRKTTQEWVESMEAEDIWCAPVYDYEQLFNDPQVQENEMVVSVEGPTGTLKLPGIPVKLSKTPGSVRHAPPMVGEHTNEVLAEIGYSLEDIQALRRDKAVG